MSPSALNGGCFGLKKKREIHYAWIILVACCALQGVSCGIMINCYGIFLKTVASDLGFSMSSFVLHMTIRTLVMGFLCPYATKLFAKKNIRVVLSLAVIGGCGSFAMMSCFNALWQWYIGGILVGIAGSFLLLTLSSVIIGNWFTEKYGFAMGISASSSGIIAMLFNPIGALIIENFGWRMAYLVLGGITLILTLPFALFVIRFRPADMGLEPYGGVHEKSAKKETVQSNGIPADIAKKSSCFVLLFVFTGLASFMTGYGQHMTPFSESLGINAAIAATMVSVAQGGKIVANLSLGSLSDRIGGKKTSVACLLLFVAGMSLFLFGAGKVPVMLMGACLMGLIETFSLVYCPMVVRDAFGRESFEELFPLISVGASLIGAFGTTVIGFIYDMAGDYRPAWAVGIIITIVLIVMLLVIYRLATKLAKKHMQ